MTKSRSNATAPNAKGTLVVGNGTDASTTLAVASTAGYVLTVDSAESTGVKWAAASTPNFVGCAAYLSNNQVISNDVSTAITLDAEIVDSDGFHSNTTNNTRMTIPSGKAGKYYIYASVGMSNGNSSTGTRRIYIRKNGTTVFDYLTGPPAATWFAQSASVIQDLAVGDYIELFVNQSSGSSISYYGDSSVTKACQLGLIYLGA